MARARNIKPGFFANEDLAECEPLARLLFAGLWCLADREGRLEDRPKRIRAELLPYDMCDADNLLNQLQERGFILRYTHGEGRFIQVLKFDSHQNPHIKEAKSTIPAPGAPVVAPTHVAATTVQAPAKEDAAPDKHSASTVQAPDQHQTSPAESGFSDSLIPDSLTPSNEGVVRTLQAEACMAMKAAGMAAVNPSNPKLTALLEAGITVAELVAAAADAVAKGKPFAYALASAEGRRRDAATAPLPNVVQRDAPVETYAQRAARQRMEEVAPMAARKQPGSAFDAAQRFIQGEVIDVAEVPKQLARVV